MQDGKVTAIDVKNYFGYKDAGSFAPDWKKLTQQDKEELVASLQKLVDEKKYLP